MIGEVFPFKARGLSQALVVLPTGRQIWVALVFPFFFEKLGNALFLFFAIMAIFVNILHQI